MNIIQLLYGSLRKPVTIIVAVIAIIFFSVISIRNIPVDIFPKLGTPTIYVAQTYGGLSAEQLEGYITSYYEYHFLYVTGIKSVESKTIQGVTLLKLNFHEGTDMGQATGEVVAMVNRARAFMPPGTISPFVTRFDGGSVPVGQLVFSSTRSLSEVQDLALFKVRPMFSTLPGVSAPPPFGGNQRTVLIKADPDKLRSYNVTPQDLVTAIAKGNVITPSGNIRVGDQTLITPQNTVVENIQDLANIPIKTGSGPTVFVHDVAAVDNGADITSGYALINGKRSVYIPVTKRADASTWDVVQRVKAALPDMQAAIPADIKVSYEFDQSGYVINSIKSLTTEGILGAVLTGLMVLLFLRDWRGSLIVVLTIPLALLSAVICLKLFGQSINIMTLGGLALAVGILVDEATVTIENIHHHQEKGEPKGRAILEASKEIALPKLLILLCILAIFFPAFFMSGIPKAMFLPLSLAVGLAMIASFLLSQSFVPVMANWLFKDHLSENAKEGEKMSKFKDRHVKWLKKAATASTLIVTVYLLVSVVAAVLLFNVLGKELFPKVDAGQFQVRVRLADGTRLERTETKTKALLALIDSLSGGEKIAITSAFIGNQGSSYPVNAIHLWTSGPQEAVLKANFVENAGINLEDFKETLRKEVALKIPGMQISFEPSDLVDQVMSQGTNTPVQIRILGKNLLQDRDFAQRILDQLHKLPYLRDITYGAPQSYPAMKLEFDRVRLGQLGLTVDDASKSLIAATSSSRFTQPNYWLDKTNATAYQVQVQVPEFIMNDPGKVDNILLGSNGGKQVFMRDVASWKMGRIEGEYDRLNQKRFITLTANLHGKSLGAAIGDIDKIIAGLGKLPDGMKIQQQGQAEVFQQTFDELQTGVLLAIVVIFLLLAVNFQSFRISLIVIGIIPGVLTGCFLLLWLTGKTLNIQSYMGCIMAIGVAVANAILFIKQAENYRKLRTKNSFLIGIRDRTRPILMTGLAMIAGMVPMASGIGEGGDQTAPLGIAVIGGLLFGLLLSLLILPLIYHALAGDRPVKLISLDPDDKESKYFTITEPNA
ncbi:efflux RND transporter permease subunit [Mucilaginibacter rubeus]|uniref:Efflux RND transporter permease subunit n=2 Tax=Mucilaginibacter rubeus TaxID=2027860 RepID=A0AAE6JDP1_9SPHI|nr:MULTISPECIES: efflux RND transporter permease subunit [Mucilaginibacter]QEM03819.1 efflux RND transporter permease subunit [Mucilaginibacter rubeus]QEM16429.1 efflux RND transporter permease subunit [Mucilaginibacter gossypii]QTE40802.1 efflux RND transporter permease subunit [Mucilaginibacter rubeus]QTE47404.1 efflux RND transporter permease subunit [Mucilaginibacter rubeus]QTE58798.1 efflux RND transporter permease subunit [Mucilaginibacter rubeus]